MSSWSAADLASLQPNSSFDGFRQDFVILLPDGTTPMTANMEDFNLLQKSQLNQGIIYGAQIGVTALLFLIMLIMTKPDKRRSVVFLLNSLALLFILVRTSMAVRLLAGPFFNFYIFELAWYPYVEEIAYSIRLSVATEVLGVFVNGFIFASLVLQVHIICCTLDDIQHKLVIGFCCLLAAMVCILRLTLAIMNSMWDIVGLRTVTEEQWGTIQRMASANNIASITCIAIFSAIFNTKLVLAILARRKLNMKQFGPMQIIFVMGLQTMFVPRELSLGLHIWHHTDTMGSHHRDRGLLRRHRLSAIDVCRHGRGSLSPAVGHVGVGQHQQHFPRQRRQSSRRPSGRFEQFQLL